MTERVPRPEYPRPQLERPRWHCLNGSWQLEVDTTDRGLRDGWERGRDFSRRVRVPYPLESQLSGIGQPGPFGPVWYRRHFRAADAGQHARLRLWIGACDHETRVFVDGAQLAHHRGGYTPIACDLDPARLAGDTELVLRVEDRDTWTQPRGKQSAGPVRMPIDYDPVTGVWQSVWLEPLPAVAIDGAWTEWQHAQRRLLVRVATDDVWPGEIDVELRRGDQLVAREAGGGIGRPEARLSLAVPDPELWSPEHPALYRLVVRLRRDERVVDEVASHVGLREIGWDGGRLVLNEAPLYLRGVLDQGYFPGGWYAAATDDDLRQDVELTRALGFNCARKHQKLEDPRYLHWADRLGLLVWVEMPSARDFTSRLVAELAREWSAAVRRDRAHPSVMAWVPFNESWGVWEQAHRREQRAFVEGMVGLTRALDPTRPVVGNDGWEYSEGDLWTLHLYPGESEDVATNLRRLLADPSAAVLPEGHLLGKRVGALPGSDPRGLPIVLSECGGVGYLPPGTPAPEHPLFAYGDWPHDAVALERRVAEELAALREAPELSGFVWTQLTDVQQEVNGLLDFERRPKLPLDTFRRLFGAAGA